MEKGEPRFAVSRRQVLGGTAAALGVAGGAALLSLDEDPAPQAGVLGPDAIPIELRINGRVRTLDVEPRVTLLDALRERLGMTGTKKGCDRGECGACTVLADGRRITSCSTLAIMAQDTDITTIEGLSEGDDLHPLQDAFIRFDALQCGFCTPGQIMSAIGMLSEPGFENPGDDRIREGMSGNLCRCSCYPNIVAAIADVGRSADG